MNHFFIKTAWRNSESIFFVFLSLLVLLLVSACHQATPLYKKEFTPEQKTQYAKQLLDGVGRYYQGMPENYFLMQEALSLDTSNADIYRELGVAPLKRGLISQFQDGYAKAVELNPLAWQAWRGYLHLYFHRDYNNAIKDFDAADPLTPNFVDYPQSQSIDLMRGICYLMKEDYPRALHYFDKHFAYESKEIGIKYLENKAFLYQGISHFKMGAFQKAIDIFDLGLQYNTTAPDLYFWKAKCLLALQGDAKAITTTVEQVKQQFNRRNQRGYVEEFYQLYWSDVEELEAALENL